MSGEVLNVSISGISILLDCLKLMMAVSYLWDMKNDSTTHVLIAQ